MAQQQIVTKPYVEELQDNDSLFINHDGALRQIKKSGADFASGADMRAEVAAREAFETSVGEQIAEFDSNAAALQTEVDRLRGECDNLAAENRKQENRIDALMKLNKGQTYDVLGQESEAYSVDVPSGAKYMGIDMVGGKSVVWNQLINPLCFRATATNSGVTFTNNGNGSITVSGTATSSGYVRLSAFFDSNAISVIGGHKHYCKLPNVIERVTLSNANNSTSVYNENQILSINTNGAVSYDLYFTSGVTYNYTFKPQIFDLTAMFGAGNEPSTVEEFEAMFPKDYYPYSEPTIISSQTDRVDVASADGTITRQMTTGFPVLNSAGSVYDYIDLNERKLHQRVGEFILTDETDISLISYTEDTGIYLYQFMISVNNTPNDIPNVCNRFTYYAFDKRGVAWKTDGAIVSSQEGVTRLATKMNMDELKAFLSANEAIIQYVLTEPVITDIEIPTELTDWLEVEAGGSVTFHDADESKQLAVPNAVSWVRKLNEVE